MNKYRIYFKSNLTGRCDGAREVDREQLLKIMDEFQPERDGFMPAKIWWSSDVTHVEMYDKHNTQTLVILIQ